MRFKILLVGALLAIVGGSVWAQEWVHPLKTDHGPVTMHVTSGASYWSALFNPAAADTDAVHSVYATSASAATTQTFTAAESAVLDYPRNVTLTISGTTANVNGGTTTLTGKNILGDTITEAYTLTENTVETLTGAKAFKSVSSLLINIQDGTNVKVSVGIGSKFGMQTTNVTNGVVLADVDGIKETTAPTVAVSGAAIESNTISFNTAPNGTKDFSYVTLVSPYRVTTSDTR